VCSLEVSAKHLAFITEEATKCHYRLQQEQRLTSTPLTKRISPQLKACQFAKPIAEVLSLDSTGHDAMDSFCGLTDMTGQKEKA